MSDEKVYTQAEVNTAVKAALAETRREYAELRRAAAKLAELKANLASAEGEPEAVTTNHEALVAAADSADLDLSQLLRDTAGSAGASDPNIVAGLIEPERVAYDEDGSPVNVEQLVADVLENRPYLNTNAPSGPRMSADQGARASHPTSVEHALHLLKHSPGEFDRLVRSGHIAANIFGGR